MNKFIFSSLIAALGFAAVPMTVSAGDFDGSKPLICASLFATECRAEAQRCVSGPPWDFNLPVFSAVDFKAQTVATTYPNQDERVSKIESVDRLANGRLSLQGDDGQYSWSAIISEESGSMTMTAAGEEIGFIMFGACTVR
jgi:hypothetical protein